MNKWKKLGLGALVVWVGMQVVPFGRDHDNPKVIQEPAWNSPETRALAQRACFDCHSNQTKWPWYSWVAPISWLVTNDVMGGRHHLNFSEWHLPQRDADEAVEAVREGWMPPAIYTPLHPEAVLTAEESARLAEGLLATPGFAPSPKEHAPKREEREEEEN